MLTINDSDVTSPQLVNITGTGSNIGISQNALYPGLKFAQQSLGVASNPLNVTLTNKGTTPITISSLQMVGDFSQTNKCNNTIPVGGKCVISVKFTPTQTDYRYGALVVNSSDPASPHTIRAYGPATQVSLNPTSLTFGASSGGHNQRLTDLHRGECWNAEAHLRQHRGHRRLCPDQQLSQPNAAGTHLHSDCNLHAHRDWSTNGQCSPQRQQWQHHQPRVCDVDGNRAVGARRKHGHRISCRFGQP